MAFNKSPQDWIDGIVSIEDDHVTPESLVIPLSSIPELTSAEVNDTTGDIRRLLFAVVDSFYQAWNAKPNADRPVRMTVSRQTTVNDALGTTTRNYTFSFAISTGSIEVAPEPV
jgi:hypothetical protein